MDTLIIGIAGGTGSGKTTITKKIAETFGNDVSVLYHDNYYKALDGLTYDERAVINFDHPDAFDTGILIDNLKSLKRGEEAFCPVYDFTVHNRVRGASQKIEPRKVIVVDGILILCEKELRDLFDIKIFVDTDADVRILRRLTRDVKKRARTIESVVSQYLTTVKPMHEQFVEPSKRYADIIIPEGGKNTIALDMLFSRIRAHLDNR